MREYKFIAWNGIEMSEPCNPFFDNAFIFPSGENVFVNDAEGWGLKVMQFTGLKDKNNKDIYEGYILRIAPSDKWDETNFSCFEVFFHDGDANSGHNIGYSLRMHNHGSVSGGYIPSFKPTPAARMICIGNIYENPELI